MKNTYFIIGTDTNCGKTYVTVALLAYLRERHKNARGLKPIASGCYQENNRLVNEDIRCLELANQSTEVPIHQWMMSLPISPHLAAKSEGISLSVSEILAFCESYPKQDLDCLLIEGAGGLFVPLNDEETWVDFLIQSQIPVILVVGMRLGCINHALLTMHALKTLQIKCVGWIANFLDPQMLASEENLATLLHKIDYPRLGTLPFQGKFKEDLAFATLLASGDLDITA